MWEIAWTLSRPFQDDCVSIRQHGIVQDGARVLRTVSSMQSAQRSERGAQLIDKELRLFPRRKVPTFFKLVVMNEFGERPHSPTPGSCIDLVRKDTYGNWDGDVPDVKEGPLVFPIETSRRDRRVRQPVECDVVQDVITREPFRLSVEDTCDEFVAAHIVIEDPGCQADG